jgi:lipase maturation factor 1
MQTRPVLIYDGECPFCRVWAGQWQRHTSHRVIYAPLQEAHSWFPAIPRSEFRRSVHLILPDGTACRGAEAVFELVALWSRPGRALRWLYRHMPGFGRLAEWFYRFIAEHRPFFLGLTRSIFGQRIGPPARRA